MNGRRAYLLFVFLLVLLVFGVGTKIVSAAESPAETAESGEMKEAKTTYFAQLNNCYVIIENVPCLKCEQCGEEFLNITVAEKIDDILDSIENIASKIFILDYTTAA